MTKENKMQILSAMEAWMSKNGYSANEFATKSGVPANYISLLRNGKYEVPTGTGQTPISDKYFRMIAEAIGFENTQAVSWKFVQTTQALQMLTALEDAKAYGYTNLIIGETGSGKTYISDLFVRQNPKDNFKITVGSMDSISDLMDKICDALKIPAVTNKAKKIASIIKELQEMRLNGRNPILIFDEAEYMKQPTLCNMKELHDHLNKKCGLVLIGTDQLLAKIEKMKRKNAPGMPQFYRRVKFGVRVLKAINTNFTEFLGGLDKGVQKFLQRECDNYGELHDVLLPAMREAERLGEPLTEDLVRKVLNMPKV